MKVAGYKINMLQVNSFPICQTQTFINAKEQKKLTHDSNENYKMPKKI